MFPPPPSPPISCSTPCFFLPPIPLSRPVSSKTIRFFNYLTCILLPCTPPPPTHTHTHSPTHAPTHLIPSPSPHLFDVSDGGFQLEPLIKGPQQLLLHEQILILQLSVARGQLLVPLQVFYLVVLNTDNTLYSNHLVVLNTDNTLYSHHLVVMNTDNMLYSHHLVVMNTDNTAITLWS